jgi:hypothetical protein
MNWFKKSSGLLLVICLVSSVIFYSLSCKSSSVNEEAMVQIWRSADANAPQEEPLAYGLVVGNGQQIITVINYEDEIAETLYIGRPGQPRYPATVKALDPRNSVTLLYMSNSVFPKADIAQAGSYQLGDNVTVHGWRVTDFQKIEQRQGNFPGAGNRFILEEGPWIDLPGAIVTEGDGKVIGLLGTDYNAFVFRFGPPGMTAPIIDINNALELLSPDAVNKPWAKGPVNMIIAAKNTLTGQALSQPPDANYVEITSDIQALLETMGEPLPVDELPTDYRNYSWGSSQNVDGTLLSVLYPHQIELRDTSGKLVGIAKWVGIQWGRTEGKPNQLLYGRIEQGNPIVEGGFVIEGNITELENDLHP